jgi:predicted nucleotidyltransferase
MPLDEPDELLELDLPSRHLSLLRELLLRHVPEAEVWAFGSRVVGGAHEGSDLDLVLRNPRELKTPVAGYFALREAIRDSRIPILVDLHDWALLPPAFHAEIEADYVVVQRAPT